MEHFFFAGGVACSRVTPLREGIRALDWPGVFGGIWDAVVWGYCYSATSV